MNHRIKISATALLNALALVCHAGVTVTQNVSPGATSWPGGPILSTVAIPSNDASAESFNGGGGNTNLSQTFTVTTTNYSLQTVEIYVSGGSGGGITLNLYDLGTQTAPNPSPYTGNANLLGSGAGLSVTLNTQVAASILKFDFTGMDQAYLQAGHMYAFELAGTLNTTPLYWERGTNDTYAGGAAYRNQAWINNNNARDFALAIYASVTTQAPPPVVCAVDWNSVFQRIDGFGAASSWRPNWTTNQADMFFSTNLGIGLSLLRTRVAPGGVTVENSIMQMAQARGARVWSTPWSPQASFKDTNSVNGGNFVSSVANCQAYASQLAAYVGSMKTNYGVNLYALSIQNEPDVNTTGYESCVWNAQQFHVFIPYLYAALSNYGLASTRIVMAEDEHWQFNLTSNTMSDPNTAAMVGILAAHNYGSSPAAVANFGKGLWETEISLLSGNDSSISNGVYWAGQIHQFLTVAQVNAWHYWWLITGNSTGNQGLLDINGTPAKRMYALGNYSLFVRPNYYRIGVPTNTGTLLISAYKDPASSNFALVAINPGSTPVTQVFNLANFASGYVVPWTTSATQSLASNAPIPVVLSTFTSTLQPMTVVTFVGNASSAPISIGLTNVSASPRQTGAIITWNTSYPASSQVQYGLSTNYGSATAFDSALLTNHMVWLSGLLPNTTYYYRVVSIQSGNPFVSAGSSFFTDPSLIVSSSQALYSGVWVNDSAAPDKYSSVYKFATTMNPPDTAQAAFRPNLINPGQYDIFIWYSAGGNRSATAPVTVSFPGGGFTTNVDMTVNGGRWNLLAAGQYMPAGTNSFVRLGNGTGETNKIVIADAVRWTYSAGQDANYFGNVPAWWSSYYFGTANVDGTLDPDGDGYTTFMEYLLGTDPTDARSRLQLSGQPMPGGVAMVFSPYQSGRTYQAQAADAVPGSLAWTNLASPPVMVNTNGQGIITVTNIFGGGKFLRLSVQLTP